MSEQSCEMKGFLAFLTLWIIYKQPGTGADIAREIEKRKGTKPSPGTIYPVLKDLKQKELIEQEGDNYQLTCKGKEELASLCKVFKEIFYDVDEICTCKKIE